MPTLNLKSDDFYMLKVIEFLEQNASEALADKINNGVFIEKDGKRLLNKKDINGFDQYTYTLAEKLVAEKKGKHCVRITNTEVYEWAVKYFDDDTVEGTLYNEDGTEYKPPKPVTQTTKPAATYTPPKPQPKPQMSLFELMENPATEQTTDSATPAPESKAEESPAVSHNPEENGFADEEEPTAEELLEAAEIAKNEEQDEPTEPKKGQPKSEISLTEKAVQPQGSPFYQRYMQVQDKYPDHIVLYKRGDFYEALGKGAQILAENLALTLTGRDCGLSERVPMVGIPCHAVDNYIGKAIENGLKIALTDPLGEVEEYPQKRTAMPPAEKPQEKPKPVPVPASEPNHAEEDGKHWIDGKTYIDDDGVVHTVEEDAAPAFDMSAYDTVALAVLDDIFGNLLELR